ncbi:MAG: sigma-70 family RNA polymerase sigma factor, partial [Planctomycetota bacterium]|nr:sigma-70 family RNA polymerase sigma factor [Planctomycetota bacterium]
MESESTLRPEDYLAYAGSLRTLALQLVRDEHEADDVVQDTWLAALHRPPAERSGLRWWLGAVARNVARQSRRSEGRRAERQRRVSVPERLPPTEEIAERAAMHREIVDRVLSLDETYRVVLLLRYFEDLTPKQIASQLGVPVATVNTRLLRARVRLRETLDRRFGDRTSWCQWFLLGLGKTGAGGLSIVSLPLIPIAQTAAIAALVGFVGYVCVRVYLDERGSDGPRGVVALPLVPTVGPERELVEARVSESDDVPRREIETRSAPLASDVDPPPKRKLEKTRDRDRPAKALRPWKGKGIPGLVRIRGGETKIGTHLEDFLRLVKHNEAMRNTLVGETPQHTAQVDDFFLGVTEVTNEQYHQYLRATGAEPPKEGADADLIAELAALGYGVEDEAGNRELHEQVADLPVTYVDYAEARAYARWAGLRLMSEFEFQRAARGNTDRVYPWGDSWSGAYAASNETDRARPFPVGHFWQGAVDGVFDLSGNVWEWTSSPYVGYPGYKPISVTIGKGKQARKLQGVARVDANKRVAVGGSAKNPKLALRVATRRNTDRSQTTDSLGFRVAASMDAARDMAERVLEELDPRQDESDVGFLPHQAGILERWTSVVGRARNRVPRYEVITGYDCILFVPAERASGGLEDQVIVLGILHTTVSVEEPKLAPGTYSVVRLGGSFVLGGSLEDLEGDSFVFADEDGGFVSVPAPPLRKASPLPTRIAYE